MRDGVLLFQRYWRFQDHFHVTLKESVFAKELLHRPPDPIISGTVSLIYIYIITMHTNRGIIGTLTKRNLFHLVFKLFCGAAYAITWIFWIDCLDNFVAVGIKVSDCAVSGECYSCAGITTMAEIVEYQRTLKEEVSDQKTLIKRPLVQVDMELG